MLDIIEEDRSMQGIRKAIKHMLADEDISQAELARRIDQKPQVLNRKIVDESMRYNEAEAIADHFGYNLVWIKRRPPEA